VIQRVGPNAVGATGMGIGYGGIATSIGVKFDLYNNLGEGINSTGLFTNGTTPTTPATTLNGTGIDLHSGHVFNVAIAYQGTTLTVVITDTTTNVSATQTYTVNIPTTIGGNTAYVGITGST